MLGVSFLLPGLEQHDYVSIHSRNPNASPLNTIDLGHPGNISPLLLDIPLGVIHVSVPLAHQPHHQPHRLRLAHHLHPFQPHPPRQLVRPRGRDHPLAARGQKPSVPGSLQPPVHLLPRRPSRTPCGGRPLQPFQLPCHAGHRLAFQPAGDDPRPGVDAFLVVRRAWHSSRSRSRSCRREGHVDVDGGPEGRDVSAQVHAQRGDLGQPAPAVVVAALARFFFFFFFFFFFYSFFFLL
ncbi:hypothetical protein VTK26DRAFT_4055 [Humicola hyalothermophila]